MTLSREIIPYTTRDAWLAARRFDITSSEVSALFGCNPYVSAYELWHQKAGNIEPEYDDNERMRWGLRLEPAIAAGVCEDNGWQGRPMSEYIRLPDHRAGSSFDWLILDENNDERPLEIKNVDVQALRNGWIVVYATEDEPGYLEAPTRIELQLQHQMLVSGYSRISLAALVGGNSIRLLHREADEVVQTEILAAIDAFWASVAAGKPPAPDYYRDSEIIRRLHPAISGEPLALVEEDRITTLMREHRVCSDTEKRAKEDKDARATEIRHLLGDRPGARGPAGSITRFPVAGGTVSYERKPRIDMRITHAKK